MLIDLHTGYLDGWYFERDLALEVLDGHQQNYSGNWVLLRYEDAAVPVERTGIPGYLTVAAGVGLRRVDRD